MIVQARLCFDQTFNSGQKQNIPARRKFLFRPNAICFCSVGRLSPQAKDLCGKLSALRTVQRLDPQKQIGRTSSGENSLFSPLAISQARSSRQSPFSAIPTKRKFFFRKACHRKAYKKRIWSDYRGKSGFPSVPLESSFF